MYAMGMHELSRQVAAVCREQGQLLANLMYRCTVMFNTLPSLFKFVLDKQREAIATLQKTLLRRTKASEEEMNANMASLVDFVASSAFKEGSTALQVVQMWRGKKKEEAAQRANRLVSTLAGRLRRRALSSKLSRNTEAFEERLRGVQEALKAEKQRTRRLQEQVDGLTVLRQQCMELTLSLDRERNAVRAREADIDKLKLDIVRMKSRLAQTVIVASSSPVLGRGVDTKTGKLDPEDSGRSPEVEQLRERVAELQKERDELLARFGESQATDGTDEGGYYGSQRSAHGVSVGHSDDDDDDSDAGSFRRPTSTMSRATSPSPPHARGRSSERRTGNRKGGEAGSGGESGTVNGRTPRSARSTDTGSSLRDGRRQAGRGEEPVLHARFPFELLGRESHERGYVCTVRPKALGPSSEAAGFHAQSAFARWVGWQAPSAKGHRKSGSGSSRRLLMKGAPASRVWGAGAAAAAVEVTGLPHDLDVSNAPLLMLRRTIAEIYEAKRRADQVRWHRRRCLCSMMRGVDIALGSCVSALLGLLLVMSRMPIVEMWHPLHFRTSCSVGSSNSLKFEQQRVLKECC